MAEGYGYMGALLVLLFFPSHEMLTLIFLLAKCPESINDCMFAYDAETVVSKYLADQEVSRSAHCS